MGNPQIGVRLEQALYDRLKEQAEVEGKGLAEMARDCIKYALEDQEDQEDQEDEIGGGAEPEQPAVLYDCPRCLLECRDKPTANGCDSCRPIQVLKPIRTIKRA